jgi:C-terminal processing protease CtpA/Prc
MGGETVRSVRADGPAFEAGIHVDDVLEEIDGEEFRGDLDDMLARIAPGTVVKLTVERRGESRDFEVTTTEAPVERWALERTENPTALQRHVYETWLGSPWPKPELPAHDPPVPADP